MRAGSRRARQKPDWRELNAYTLGVQAYISRRYLDFL